MGPDLTLVHIINDMAGKNSVLDTTMIFAAQYLICIFAIYLADTWFAKNKYRQEALFAGYAALLGLGINLISLNSIFTRDPLWFPQGRYLSRMPPSHPFHLTMLL
ncbi:hypothetical protein [Methanosarcina sp. 2.H.A.1B.4]|uniref:hypothetical protein n=1 Tax=Methanosarcina sp. 2.H.A.1B.4 TaxID=1483600 RepID=UPI000ACC2701|nr:hypothetical protein [Methanosarcina sp. 2.H.A.1B.4]